MTDRRPERCPTCGVTDYSEDCLFRYDDIGCDHPALIREVAAELGFHIRRGETQERKHD